MAKKFVRGVTGIEDIESYDKSLTNVNDLISDGKATYVHTKQGKNEKYVNITDKITSITSGDTGLIDVSMTGDNNANLTPKHDTQKEQLLESTRNTVTIEHGSNGTSEKTKVDTNPQKVLEHDNLLTDYGISKNTSGNTTKLGVEYTKVNDGFDLNSLSNGFVRGNDLTNAPTGGWYFIDTFGEGSYIIQKATQLNFPNTQHIRLKWGNIWTDWREQVGDKSAIDALLAQKQNKLTAGDGISFIGDTISLKVLDQYNGNLNDLVYTCLVKPVDNAPNLPTGVAGNGILTVIRIGDVVKQTYQTYSNDGLYIRTAYQVGINSNWTNWQKIVTQTVS